MASTATMVRNVMEETYKYYNPGYYNPKTFEEMVKALKMIFPSYCVASELGSTYSRAGTAEDIIQVRNDEICENLVMYSYDPLMDESE